MKKFLFLFLLVECVFAARVKDVARLEGAEDQALVGYGLVVGLNGTGDGSGSSFTVQSTINMLRNLGIEVPSEKIRLRNVAAVMVTAKLSPFHRKGSKIDVTLSSMGDAHSLEGGVLLMTPLQTPDGEVYALAQGSLTVGGYSVQGKKSSSMEAKGHVLTAMLPAGATVQNPLGNPLIGVEEIRYVLNEPDYNSAVAMADAINKALGGTSAVAEDAGSVKIKIPEAQKNALPALLAKAENASFSPSSSAKVVLNERTGTVVVGNEVKIMPVAIAHGGIKIVIEDSSGVSQPAPKSAGKTTPTTSEKIKVTEEKNQMQVLPQINTVNQLADALNKMGLSPRDIISIFEAIKAAGALQGELVLM